MPSGCGCYIMGKMVSIYGEMALVEGEMEEASGENGCGGGRVANIPFSFR